MRFRSAPKDATRAVTMSWGGRARAKLSLNPALPNACSALTPPTGSWGRAQTPTADFGVETRTGEQDTCLGCNLQLGTAEAQLEPGLQPPSGLNLHNLHGSARPVPVCGCSSAPCLSSCPPRAFQPQNQAEQRTSLQTNSCLSHSYQGAVTFGLPQGNKGKSKISTRSNPAPAGLSRKGW